LVLDEPTNHLDLASKEVLKQALMKFDGTMLVVSHDRDFLDGLTQIVYEIKADGLRVWPGLVKDFLKEKKAETIAQFERNKVQTRADNNQTKVQPKPTTPVNDKETEKLRKKLQTQLQKTEGDIARIEEEIIQMDDVVASLDYSDAELSKNTLDKYSLLKSQLDEAYSQWETVGQQLSEL
jgi:ATP-binding cassette subfamily F protein 3